MNATVPAPPSAPSPARVKNSEPQVNLQKFAWLSIAAALATIGIKAGAYLVTGSVSLLSDAMESMVNLVAAIVALFALRAAARPADSRYTFGRSKAEYFSAAIEGVMIFGAAALIIFAAVQRLITPAPVENLGIGILISSAASALNGVVGFVLLRAGRKYKSPTLVADAKHLFTDVVTSIGVLIGVALVWITGWERLDPIVAILVGLNIVWTGIGLVRSSMAGLMDVTLLPEDNEAVIAVLKENTSELTTFHGLQTRQSGREAHIKVDAQVPGSWTVREGHNWGTNIEAAIQDAVPNAHVTVHVEPIEDPESYRDIPEGFVPLGNYEGFVPIDLETGKPKTVQQ